MLKENSHRSLQYMQCMKNINIDSIQDMENIFRD